MAGYIEGVDRSQSSLFPERLDDWIDEDDPVCAIDFFANDLDLAELGFGRTTSAKTGRSGYHLRVT